MKNNYAIFPTSDENGNNITLEFDCYELNEVYPNKGIVILATRRNNIYTSYNSIGYSEDLNKQLEPLNKYLAKNKINCILVYVCELNPDSEYYINQIKQSKKIDKSIPHML